MPRRAVPLVTGEIYHIFNRSIARQPIFTRSKDFQRFLEVVDFYRFKNLRIRFSYYNRLPIEQKSLFINSLYQTGVPKIEILSFVIMPNHYHFLAKQSDDYGIKNFISQIQNSYAKFYNTKYNRTGALFQEMFKALRIETDEQFIHVARYIHLNPLTSYQLTKYEDLDDYPLSSFTNFMGNRHLTFLNKDTLTNYFPYKKRLKEFTFNQVDYQRTLKNIEHLIIE